jgi:peptidoglycan/xylan/chitin deacetylase (PgdA/CDA1 family)
MGSSLTIFAWHNIEPTWHYPAPGGAGVRGFARQVDRLRRLGTIVPLAESVEALREGRPLPARAIALTFDDGYRDNRLALPVLEQHGLPATFFLVPDLLEGKPRAWWEVLAWAFTRAKAPRVEWEGRVYPTTGPEGRSSMERLLDSLKVLDLAGREAAVTALAERLEPGGEPEIGDMFMDGDDALELVRRGFTVGSHTMHHAILSRESPPAQHEDLATSRKWLERVLDQPMDVLAYPNGRYADFDEHTVEAAEAAGYRASVTTQAGRNVRSTHQHRLHRIVLEPHRGFAAMAGQRVRGKLGPVLSRLPGRGSPGPGRTARPDR